jgi:hypothetical protein
MITVICISLLVAFKPKQLESTDALPVLMILGWMELIPDMMIIAALAGAL